MNYSFKAQNRLKRRSDFLALQRSGRRFSHGPFRIYFITSSTPFSQLGITVRKKEGISVLRNQFKRRVREIYRQSPLIKIKGLRMSVHILSPLPISFHTIQNALFAFQSFLNTKVQ